MNQKTILIIGFVIIIIIIVFSTTLDKKEISFAYEIPTLPKRNFKFYPREDNLK
jgi:hypothetical protein